MTNLALALSLDPEFAVLARELVFMGGSLNPQTDYPEFANTPRHEFNFWFDPEAAHIVLRAPWKKMVCTPTDISIKARLTPAMVKRIEAAGTPLARYVARFYQEGALADILGTTAIVGKKQDQRVLVRADLLELRADRIALDSQPAAAPDRCNDWPTR